MTALGILLCGLLLLSLVSNIRQALLWKPEHQGRQIAEQKARQSKGRAEAAEKTARRWKKQAKHYQRLYDEEEQSGWTAAGLTLEKGEIPQNRTRQPHGVQVRVGSLRTPIEDPIRLRFWFSREVDDSPLVWFMPDHTYHTSADMEQSLASGAGSTEIGPNGRLDVVWTGDQLDENSRLVVGVYAKETGAEIDLLSVERRRW